MQEHPRPSAKDDPSQAPGPDLKTELAKLAFEAPPEPLQITAGSKR